MGWQPSHKLPPKQISWQSVKVCSVKTQLKTMLRTLKKKHRRSADASSCKTPRGSSTPKRFSRMVNLVLPKRSKLTKIMFSTISRTPRKNCLVNFVTVARKQIDWMTCWPKWRSTLASSWSRTSVPTTRIFERRTRAIKMEPKIQILKPPAQKGGWRNREKGKTLTVLLTTKIRECWPDWPRNPLASRVNSNSGTTNSTDSTGWSASTKLELMEFWLTRWVSEKPFNRFR